MANINRNRLAFIFMVFSLWLFVPSGVQCREIKICVWCEFLPYEIVENYLEELREKDISLILHIGPSDIGSPALLKLLYKAEKCGVDVRAWFLLPYDEDLYFCEDTLDQTENFVRDFVKWAKDESLNIKWVVFDCEPTPTTGKEFLKYVREKDIMSFITHLRKNKNEQKFRQSIKRMSSLIDYLHKEGYFVAGTSNRMVIEGLYFKNVTLQDSLNIPFTMLDWDEVSFLAYRYKASRADYIGMVKRYTMLAKKYFGEKGVLDIGLVGDNRLLEENKERMRIFDGKEAFMDFLIGMKYPRDLTEIMDVIKKSGLFRVNIYSLDGMLVSDYPVSAWLEQEKNNGKTYFTPLSSLKAGFTNASLQLLYNVLVVKDDDLEKEYNKIYRPKNCSPGNKKSRLELKRENLEK